MRQDEVQQILARYKKLKEKRQNWLPLWQRVGEHVHLRKQNFMEKNRPGDFLAHELFDSTGAKALRKMSSTLIGMLWKSNGKSFRIEPSRALPSNPEIKAYFEFLNSRLAEAIDDPVAGFAISLEEYFNDMGGFGTGGISVFDGQENDLMFKAWGVDEVCIAEGPNGFIDTIYREVKWPLRKAIQRYGKKLPRQYHEKAKDGGWDDEINILQAIQPREMLKRRARGNKSFPFMSVHIDLETQTPIVESGFPELPAAFARYFLHKGEEYGRSPAIDALPDILELNAVREALILAQEKSLDPPLGVLDDGSLGSGTIDTSAGALNVINVAGRATTTNPVFPLFTVGSTPEAKERAVQLEQSINEHFNIDRLLDFNNQTQMTLGEAHLRMQLRADSLGSLFTRQYAELFTPLLQRSLSLLFRSGKLGIIKGSPEYVELVNQGVENPFTIPDPVARIMLAGQEFYSIKYLTPAAQMMQTEEAQGVLRTWDFANQVGQVNPEIYDMLDADESLKVISSVNGAPSSILKSSEAVQQTRQMRAIQQQQLEQAQQLQQGAEIAKTGSEVAKNLQAG